MESNDAKILRETRRLIDALFNQNKPKVDPSEFDENVFLNCMGLAFAAAECLDSYLTLKAHNRIARGILARSIFELGLTCVWLSLRGIEGFDALRWNYERNRKNLAKSLPDDLHSEPLRSSVERVLSADLIKPNDFTGETQSIIKMMDAFNTRTPLYAIYRMYSGHSHASLNVANSYLEKLNDGSVGIIFPSTHETINDHVGTLVAPFIWAAHTVDKMLVDRPFSVQVAKIQELLGTIIDFTLIEKTE